MQPLEVLLLALAALLCVVAFAKPRSPRSFGKLPRDPWPFRVFAVSNAAVMVALVAGVLQQPYFTYAMLGAIIVSFATMLVRRFGVRAG